MITIDFPPEHPSGHLFDGKSMYDLRDVSTSYCMIYTECKAFLSEFIGWVTHRGEYAQLLLAGVMRVGDPQN